MVKSVPVPPATPKGSPRPAGKPGPRIVKGK
jgi:hypothetical protein